MKIKKMSAETNEWIAFLEKLLADADKNKTIVEKLHELYKQREVYQQNKKLNEAGLAPLHGTTQEFATLIAKDFDFWGKAIRDAGIKVDQ